MSVATNWPKAVQPLLKKYRSEPHPLAYKSLYQLLVMVVLSAQDSDKHINQMAPDIFRRFPNMTALSKASQDAIMDITRGIRNFANKSKWLSTIGRTIKRDGAIPLTMDSLTELSGIGRKSANVILREAGKPAEGIVVDLHVVRVTLRLGVATANNPNAIEKELMTVFPTKDWDVGMSFSFLGRDICRPKNPECPICPLKKVCQYYHQHSGYSGRNPL